MKFHSKIFNFPFSKSIFDLWPTGRPREMARASKKELSKYTNERTNDLWQIIFSFFSAFFEVPIVSLQAPIHAMIIVYDHTFSIYFKSDRNLSQPHTSIWLVHLVVSWTRISRVIGSNPVRVRERDFSTKTLLPRMTAWWGVGVPPPTSTREEKQLVGGLKPVTLTFYSNDLVQSGWSPQTHTNSHAI